MNKRTAIKFLFGFFLSLLVIVVPQWVMTNAQSSVNLTISAAASLRQAMEEIQTLYQQEKSNIRLTYNFGSSGSLQRQIEQGAPVDIFFSAATKQMDSLENQDRIVTETRKNLLSNQIVLITPKNNNKIKEFSDLTKMDVQRISIGEPNSVPAGEYGKQVLESSQVWQAIQPKMVFGKDVRSVLAYIESGNIDAGLVYATDAKISNNVKVVTTAPAYSHQAIIYPVAVIKDSKKLQESQAFIQFLSSGQAKEVFERYGFKVN
ncbi:MAG: molybdate ABC transporter substrate-binding protein [Microcystaceae cyanobacterium]